MQGEFVFLAADNRGSNKRRASRASNSGIDSASDDEGDNGSYHESTGTSDSSDDEEEKKPRDSFFWGSRIVDGRRMRVFVFPKDKQDGNLDIRNGEKGHWLIDYVLEASGDGIPPNQPEKVVS